ncbi:MAG: hypothetical protein V7K89_26590 [Nostoc sp.]
MTDIQDPAVVSQRFVEAAVAIGYNHNPALIPLCSLRSLWFDFP